MLPAEGGNPKPETKSQAYLRLSEFLVLEARGDPHTLLGVSCLQEKSYLCKLTLKNLLGRYAWCPLPMPGLFVFVVVVVVLFFKCLDFIKGFS